MKRREYAIDIVFNGINIKPPYSYFVEEIILNSKRYKMIWLIEDEQIYIGVANVYRR
jgi:hypothetical protein